MFGCCFGSFICLVLERRQKHLSIVFPGSHCGVCQHKLAFYEMIPIVSIIALRFRCRYCQTKLPLRYLYGETGFGCLGLWLSQQTFSWLRVGQFSWLFSSLIIALIDWQMLIIPLKTLYSSTLAILICWLLAKQTIYWWQPLILLLFFWIFQKFFNEGFGGGDIQLLLCWSLFLNVYQIGWLLFIASGLGLGGFLILKIKKSPQKRLPFAPFLTVALFWLLW
nr:MULTISPECIES: A24 family peptidase [unclassified Enterococcus]